MSATELIAKILEFLHLKPKTLFAIALVAGLALFAPANYLEFFGLTALIASFRAYIAIAFVVSVVLFCIEIFALVGNPFYQEVRWKQHIRHLRKRLHRLTNEEKLLLAHYIAGQTRTLYCSVANGVVGGLEAESIIGRISNISTIGMQFAYNIHPWAWEYLNQHSELLQLPEHYENNLDVSLDEGRSVRLIRSRRS